MLAKLLKYDLRNAFRYPVLTYPIVIVCAAIAGVQFGKVIAEYDLESSVEYTSLAMLLVILLEAMVIIVIVSFVTNFDKSIFGAEGYLTNALPVTAHQIVISKLIAAFMLEVVSFLVGLVSLAIFLYTMVGSYLTMADIFESLKEFFYFVSITDLAVVLEEMVGSALLLILGFYAAIAIGHMANNHKDAFSALVFLILFAIRAVMTFAMLANDFSLWMIDIFTIVCCVICYFVTTYIVAHKLNLE